MHNPQVVETVNRILQDKFEVPPENLAPTARLKEDLNLDSLDFVEMFILFESKTGKGLKDVDLLSIKTLDDIYKLVADLNVEQAAK